MGISYYTTILLQIWGMRPANCLLSHSARSAVGSWVNRSTRVGLQKCNMTAGKQVAKMQPSPLKKGWKVVQAQVEIKPCDI